MIRWTGFAPSTAAPATTCLFAVALTMASVTTNVTRAADGERAYDLRDQRNAGLEARVKLTFSVRGNLHNPSNAQPADAKKSAGTARSGEAAREVTVPMSATSRLFYDERVLVPGQQSVRIYRHCDAELAVGDQHLKRDVRASHRLLLCDDSGPTTQLLSPGGPMSREELDILLPHGSSQIIPGVLPTEPATRVGDRWSVPASVIAQLLNLEGADTSDVTAQLLEVNDGLAILRVHGVAQGYVDGATSKIRLQADVRYDIHWRHVSWCQLTVHEEREPSVVSPGLNVTAELRMRLEPLQSPVTELANPRLQKWVQQVPATASLLEVDGSRLGLKWYQAPDWHLVLEQPSGFVMRYVQRGDIVAQCNISELPKLAEGKQMSLEDFQQEVQKALGPRFGQFALARQSERRDKCRILRVDAIGAVDEVPIHWIYYNLHDAGGQRAALVFTMKEDDVDGFGDADRSIIANFKFVTPAAATASRSTSPRQ